MRSPKYCVISFTYGVSPQPAQAPENSNNGRSNWLSFTWVRLSTRRSVSGILRKNSQLARSDGRLRRHVDGLELGIGLALDRADFHTQSAAGAVFGSRLESVLLLLELLP